jgi:hypothetical protein
MPMRTRPNTHTFFRTRTVDSVVPALTICTVCAWCGTLISDGLLPDGYLSHRVCTNCAM